MSQHGATTGEPFISGYFLSKNYHIQRSRVRASINRVGPSNTALRWGAIVEGEHITLLGLIICGILMAIMLLSTDSWLL